MVAPSVEPVSRALIILEALNHEPVTSLARLHALTGLPKPTLVRLLDTLIAGGYVRRLDQRKGYCLAERVLRLASGFRQTDRIVAVARGFLQQLTADHKWPVGLATIDRDAMLVRIGTRHRSPFAIDPDYVNRRLPMLISALGRAYLAFCPEDERDHILNLLSSSRRAVDRPARDRAYVAAMVSEIRERGYATTAPIPGDPAMGLAVPVRDAHQVYATINLRYFGSALSEAQAVRRYLAPLQACAAAIAETACAGEGG